MKEVKQVGRWNEASIKDVKLLPLKVNVDERGYLIEILRMDWGVMEKFAQVYIVGNFARGVIRAFHKHEKLWDYFFISHGSAKFMLIDDREDSPTYLHLNRFVLSERNPHLLVVPPGVYHGWMSLEDDTQMISIASELYNYEKPDEVRIDPYTFGDLWTVKGR
ncbi:MAG: dTDP-4-dehydrorhamnose 3,5-epimerase family protein [Synergistetes bacterium]|nr:dTDP-4-dehydrorhamnose 3,5-epimerase family protein [Synergistota bacterium]